MVLVGYCCGIRSERRLCEDVHVKLAYRCFCRFGLEGAVPDTRPSPGIEPAGERLELSPERIAADSAYGSAEMLGWLVNERAIEPHIPVFDKSARADGTFREKTSPTINDAKLTSAQPAKS